MDIFNKRKIKQQEEMIQRLQHEIDILKSQLRGDRVCDSYCAVCKHGSVTRYSSILGDLSTVYACELDCRCKDFDSS